MRPSKATTPSACEATLAPGLVEEMAAEGGALCPRTPPPMLAPRPPPVKCVCCCLLPFVKCDPPADGHRPSPLLAPPRMARPWICDLWLSSRAAPATGTPPAGIVGATGGAGALPSAVFRRLVASRTKRSARTSSLSSVCSVLWMTAVTSGGKSQPDKRRSKSPSVATSFSPPATANSSTLAAATFLRRSCVRQAAMTHKTPQASMCQYMDGCSCVAASKSLPSAGCISPEARPAGPATHRTGPW
mmetsp:Transcript_29395/g.85050  ORF Transcript_29395/g.85050 Transcript_29395/m.85050 type:complete len:245 (-) Transcript_29395:1217-1951(-)